MLLLLQYHVLLNDVHVWAVMHEERNRFIESCSLFLVHHSFSEVEKEVEIKKEIKVEKSILR
jgi:hypothetical protein